MILSKMLRGAKDLYSVRRFQYSLLKKGLANDKFIISAVNAGLGNRIKCLLSVMRLAGMLSRRVALNWVPSEYCNCSFSDLFENDFLEISDHELNIISSRANLFATEQWYIVDTWKLLVLPSEFPLTGRLGIGIDHEYENIPETIKSDYLGYVNKLIPVKSIKSVVQDFARKFDRNTISVSIRTWAGDEDASRFSNMFKLDNFYSLMDKEKDAIFFVTCDSDDILKEVRHRYGERVITYPLRTFAGDRKSKIGVEDAFIEMLLLSQNNRMIVSAYSTFPEMAWWFGGCKARVIKVATDYILDLNNKIDNFFFPGDLLEKAEKIKGVDRQNRLKR